jgi:ABC-type antimicrobial peptide transport system permease subunit
VYLPTNTAAAKTSLVVRVKGDPGQARHALLARLTPIDPNMGAVMTLRTLAGLEAYFLKLAFWLTLVLGALALLLTLSGLFSVLSYLVEQRTKEIAVRMALGATVHNVAGEVLAQSCRPVGAGLAAGAGMALAVAMVLMATPLAAGIDGTVQVFDPLAYAASVLVIVVACALAASIPALRAARVDPMRTLRQE